MWIPRSKLCGIRDLKVLQENKYDINGYPVMIRQISYTKLPDITETHIYMLDKKGNGIEVNYGLDVTGGKNELDQVLSTFKFTDNTTSPAN